MKSLMETGKRKTENVLSIMFSLCLCVCVVNIVYAQENPPEPTSPRAVKIPKIVESKLPNGLKIIVVNRKNVPLVSVNLMISSGAFGEVDKLAGVTDMTASLLTKGTKTRTADAIAEQTEFLGSSIGGNANWMTTTVGFDVTTDNLDKAMAIFADVVLHPTFPQAEIDLYKSQAIDDLESSLKQPGTLARFVAARYTFGEHSVGGTPETIDAITRKDILRIYKEDYKPENGTIIFTGDITQVQAQLIAKKYLGLWRNPKQENLYGTTISNTNLITKTLEDYRKMMLEKPTLNRLLVVDLPNSGQAAVVFAKNMEYDGFNWKLKTLADRDNDNFFPASVANSLLGGGYSSRMNQEIRIKRGLSYGAGSSIAWRWSGGNFSTRCQTKTVSAAEVAELTLTEINRLINEDATDAELTPRKNVLNGDFGREFETNNGISGQIENLLTFNLPMSNLDLYMNGNEKVTAQQVKDFALFNLKGGDIIIVGDYKDFKDDLLKRFPNQKVEVIKASELDLNSDTLKKK
jgi:zinc protease